MFTDTDFFNAIDSAKSRLKTLQQAMERIDCCPQIKSITINLRDLSDEKLISEKFVNFPTGYRKNEKQLKFIYVIQIQDAQANLSKLRSKLYEARGDKQKKDYPRLNDHCEKTNTLYVGRSKTLPARLRQHLGKSSRGIFSLHLGRWAADNNIDITISIMDFSGYEDALVQEIEDGLWTLLKPAFGRKGAK